MPAQNSKKKHKKREKKGVTFDKCEYKCTAQPGLLQHIRSKHEGVRYNCDQCEHAATTLQDLKLHRVKKHESAIYKCDKCYYASTTELRLQKHKKANHETVSYKCDKCDYASTTALRLQKHKKANHEDVSYKCDKCDYASTSVILLQKHKQSKHEVVYYKCEECDFASILPSSLKRHKISIHYYTYSVREGDQHICRQCEYAVEMKSRLEMYKGSIQNWLYYFCDQCDFSVRSLLDLKKHKKSIHNELQFPCSYCDYYLSYLPMQRKKSILHVNMNIYDQSEQIFPTAHSVPLSHKQSKSDNGVAQTIEEPIFIETSGMNNGDSEIMREEENIEDPLALIKMDPTEIDVLQNAPGISDIGANITLEADACDLKSEIDIEEDLVLKTEASDISEFVLAAAEISIFKDKSFASEVCQQDHTYAKPGENDIVSGNRSSNHNFDLETKIEIEEDITIKTESSDLSEFLN